MTCQPNWVLTGSVVISPGCSANAASANSGTICSRRKKPRSPPVGADGPAERSSASAAKSAPACSSSITALASSSLLVRIWRACTSSWAKSSLCCNA